MRFPLAPTARYRSVYDIDGESLHQSGVRLLLVDLDNTLTAYQDATPSAELHAWVSDLRQNGVEPYILSNSRKPMRVGIFAEALGVPYRRRAGKPKRQGFFAAMAEMGAERGATAMLGDQIFTDILGANRAGIRALLVRPMRLDTIFRVLRYGLETPFRLLGGPWHGDERGLSAPKNG